jgi:hypothetical protein
MEVVVAVVAMEVAEVDMANNNRLFKRGGNGGGGY